MGSNMKHAKTLDIEEIFENQKNMNIIDIEKW